MSISLQQIGFYHEHGYLVVENFFQENECEILIREAEKMANGHYTNILNLHSTNESFYNLLMKDRILEAAESINSHRMIPIGSIFFFCKPNNDLEQGSNIHQDNYAAKAPYGSYFVCAVALDDCDESNGSLIVYPRSHRLGDLGGEPSKNFEFNEAGKIVKAYPIGNSVEVPEGYTPIQLEYKKGSLIFIHGHIAHGAPKNLSKDKWRRKIYLHYIKDGSPFWPGWNARRSIMDPKLTFKEFKNKIGI